MAAMSAAENCCADAGISSMPLASKPTASGSNAAAPPLPIMSTIASICRKTLPQLGVLMPPTGRDGNVLVLHSPGALVRYRSKIAHSEPAVARLPVGNRAGADDRSWHKSDLTETSAIGLLSGVKRTSASDCRTIAIYGVHALIQKDHIRGQRQLI